ncbi:MAG: hypothetical protein DMF49_13145 [Acidobacteria bacterium]|nr:MAG: hypothetical protein DMF49_13145 [Acidobacteriota bacterium]
MVLKYIFKLFGQRQKTEHARLPPLPPLPVKTAPDVVRAGPETVHRPIAKNLIDPDVVKIIHRLTRFGHSAYLVGGGVRDLLLHRTPKDFDVGTSALPQDIKKLFRNCRIIGRRFRLAHIFFRDKIIEVATFRANVLADESAGEGDLLIRSDNVFGTPETDALRRDFTINALFYDVDKGNVIDYVGGLADLDAGILRTIGDPDIRLREDPIRVLRALRLAGRLGFRIEEATLRAIRADAISESRPRQMAGHGEKPGTPQQDGEVFWKTLHAIDQAIARGTEFSNPTLFAALFCPRVPFLIDSLPADAPESPHHQDTGLGGADLAAALDAALSPIEQRLNISRRDRDRVRQILIAQRRFVGGRRGRRFSVSVLISRPFFPEAFDLFEILCSATGQHKDELRRWRERIASVAAQRGVGAVAGEGREAERAPRRGRRRRGGRRDPGEREVSAGRAAAGRGAPAALAPASPFADEAADRPDLTEEDVALVYGTVLAPDASAGSLPSPGGAPFRGRPRGGHRDHTIRPLSQETLRRDGKPGPARGQTAGTPRVAEATSEGGTALEGETPASKERSTGKRRRRRRGGRRHRRAGASSPGAQGTGGDAKEPHPASGSGAGSATKN